MSILHLTCPILDAGPRPSSPHDRFIRAYRPTVDAARVLSLGGSLPESSLRADGRAAPRAVGLLGELAGRQGRLVQAWLAAAEPDGVQCRGLVTLVTAGGDAAPRHSVGWLLVHPSCRRQGLGRGLVAVALDAARAAGGRAVWVEVHDGWPGALAFWTALGFVPDRSWRGMV